MKNLMNKLPRTYTSEPLGTFYAGVGTILVTAISLLIIGSFHANFVVLVFMFLASACLFRFLLRLYLYVEFKEKGISIKRVSGKSVTFNYSEFDEFYFNYEGFLGYEVLVVKSKKKIPLFRNQITIYLDSGDKGEVVQFLKGQGCRFVIKK